MRQSKFQLALRVAVVATLISGGLLLVNPGRVRGDEGEAYAIRGATLVTVTNGTIADGTIVIRRGLIEAIGAGIPVPADARVIDGKGLTVYPGLFDSYTNLGLRPPPTAGGGAGRGAADPTQAFLAQLSAPPSTVGLLPETRVVDDLQVTANTFDAQRAAGITTALTGPRSGVFQGQSALLNLGGGTTAEKLILRTPISLNVGFSGARGGYPSSLMGVFAFLRQSLLDAQHYRDTWARYRQSPRGMTRPEISPSMEALQPVIAGQLPVIFNVTTVREMKRALALAEEFQLICYLHGATQSYQIAEQLKAKNATVLLSLSFPQKTSGLEDPEDEPLAVLQERAAAPGAAVALHRAGVRFAFTSGTLSRPGDFIVNAGRAIEAGLPKEEALKALTLYPAEIFGVSDQLGSLEKGKIANLILTSGDLFAKETRVRHVFVDGHKFDIKAPEAPRAASERGVGAAPAPPARAGLALAVGTWALNLQTPAAEVSSTLTLREDGETLSGDVSTPFGSAKISGGKLSGNELQLSYSLNVQGQELTVSAKGRIEGTSIQGTMEAMGQTFSFNGTKRPN
jgi:imidazolonepropionase-like amidohydrolase